MGGGVLIYVKEVYNTSENDTINSIKCEALWIKIIVLYPVPAAGT